MDTTDGLNGRSNSSDHVLRVTLLRQLLCGQHLTALSSAVAALVTSIEVRVGDSEHSQRQDGEDTREHDESRLRMERMGRMFDLLRSVLEVGASLYLSTCPLA